MLKPVLASCVLADQIGRKTSVLCEEALGRKVSMANQYNNLDLIYQTRGELDQVEAMLKKSHGLFQDIEAAPQVELVQGWLEDLRQPD